MGYIRVELDGLNQYRVINQTDDVISFGADYTLEKLVDSEWISVLDENQPCILVLYHLEAHSSEVYSLGLELENGMYRLGKNIGIPEKDELMSISCEIYVE